MISIHKKPLHPGIYIVKAIMLGLLSIPVWIGATPIGKMLSSLDFQIGIYHRTFMYDMPAVIIESIIPIAPSAAELIQTKAPLIAWAVFCYAFLFWASFSMMRSLLLAYFDFRKSYIIEKEIRDELNIPKDEKSIQTVAPLGRHHDISSKVSSMPICNIQR